MRRFNRFQRHSDGGNKGSLRDELTVHDDGTGIGGAGGAGAAGATGAGGTESTGSVTAAAEGLAIGRLIVAACGLGVAIVGSMVVIMAGAIETPQFTTGAGAQATLW